jgi:RND superfamily putative drug exporter
MRTASLTAAQELPADNPVVHTGELIARAFSGSPLPATVVVRTPDVRGPAVTDAFTRFKQAALATGKLHEPITETAYPDKGLVVISVALDGAGTDAPSVAALRALRGEVIPATLASVDGTEVDVAGATAASVDFSDQLSRSALPVFAFVLTLAFVLMLATFRSVAVAITAVVLNLLSVGAAYGALTLVFQHGFAASLIGARTVGAISSWLPLFLFVILFGLSMDYHVFVVSRIKEGHDHGLDTRTAIARGIGSTAGVVSSAALIMVGVFAIFGTLSVTSLKEVGVGLSVAVLIDATVIRGVLLPAVMALLGERNWRRADRRPGQSAAARAQDPASPAVAVGSG